MAIPHAPKPKNPNAKPKTKPKTGASDTSLATINKTDPRKLSKAQKSRVAQLIANAATRHLLDARFLNPAQRASRELNTQLNAPVVEGSSVTNRELAQQRKVAEGLRFGAQEAQLNQDIATRQQMARDTGSFYDQYLAELRQHQANTQQINAQAVAQQQGLVSGVGAISAPPPAPAVVGATPDQQVTADAANATALRQALTASFGAQFSQQGAARNAYADTLAHVVAPTQKLSAQVQSAGNVELARKALIQEAAERGLFGQQFEQQFRDRETANVSKAQEQALAAEIAGVKLNQSQQGLEIQAANAQTARELGLANVGVAQQNADTQAKGAATAAKALGVNAADKAARTPAAQEAAKYGYTPHAWAMLGPRGRQQVKEQQARKDAANYRRAHPKAKKGPDVITSGAFAGYTKAQVAKMAPDAKQRLVDEYNKVTHPGRRGSGGSGGGTDGTAPDWHTPGEMGKALTQLTSLKTMAAKAKAGQPFVAGHAPQTAMDRRTAGQKILGFAPVASKLQDPILVTAALDAVYDGHLSPATVRALIAAGYKPSRVAQTLGVPTGVAGRRTPRPRTVRPGSSAGTTVGARLGT